MDKIVAPGMGFPRISSVSHLRELGTGPNGFAPAKAERRQKMAKDGQSLVFDVVNSLRRGANVTTLAPFRHDKSSR